MPSDSSVNTSVAKKRLLTGFTQKGKERRGDRFQVTGEEDVRSDLGKTFVINV